MESDRQPLCCDQDMAQVKSWGPANLETVHPTLSDSYMKGTEKIIKLIIRKATITVHETLNLRNKILHFLNVICESVLAKTDKITV